MRVTDALQSNRQTLATCIPEELIVSFATRLNTLNIGAMPVTDAKGALVGIISERDVMRAFARDGARLVERRVRDLMAREVVTCSPETSMSEAERLYGQASDPPPPGRRRRESHRHAFDPGRHGLEAAGFARRGQRSARNDDRDPPPPLS